MLEQAIGQSGSAKILTEDFVLTAPPHATPAGGSRATRRTTDYIPMCDGLPDFKWEGTAPPMFSDRLARAAVYLARLATFTADSIHPGIKGDRAGFRVRRT